jgi:hypothetical protein
MTKRAAAALSIALLPASQVLAQTAAPEGVAAFLAHEAERHCEACQQPRRKQHAGTSRFCGPWRHEHREPWCLAARHHF